MRRLLDASHSGGVCTWRPPLFAMSRATCYTCTRMCEQRSCAVTPHSFLFAREAAARAARRGKKKYVRLDAATSAECVKTAKARVKWSVESFKGSHCLYGWSAHVLPLGTQPSEAFVEGLRGSGALPRLAPFTSEAQDGLLPWRCDIVHTTAMSNAGIGCVLRALCSAMACPPNALGLWRDPVLKFVGAGGEQLDFSSLQACGRVRGRVWVRVQVRV